MVRKRRTQGNKKAYDIQKIKKKEDSYTQEYIKLKAELEKEKKISKERLDNFIRLQADFDNYRKRIERRKKEEKEQLIISIVKPFIDIIDNFEHALAVRPKTKEASIMIDGFRIIYDQIMKTLESFGVEEIKAEGLAFDPAYHQAVITVSCADKPDNTVVEVMRKGYRVGSNVIRHAMVKVSKSSGEKNGKSNRN